MVLHNAHVIKHLRDEIFWYESAMGADHWAALGDVAPIDAAMLLCRFNPNEDSYDDAQQVTTDELQPMHLKELTQRLADINRADQRPRTLRDWHQIARAKGLAYHSWIDRYMEATPQAKGTELAAPVVVAGATVIHSTKVRRDILTPVIECAQKQCRNPKDTAEVWAALVVLAERKTPPLLGATEDGLQFLRDGTVAAFKRDSLRKRLGR